MAIMLAASRCSANYEDVRNHSNGWAAERGIDWSRAVASLPTNVPRLVAAIRSAVVSIASGISGIIRAAGGESVANRPSGFLLSRYEGDQLLYGVSQYRAMNILRISRLSSLSVIRNLPLNAASQPH
jgi:hypothetical protein